MDRRACWLVLFVIFLPLRSGGDDSLTVQESEDLLEPGFWITLEDTIKRATLQDSAVASQHSSWRADDAGIEEIGVSGGWGMEITAREESVGGDRRETRNESLGRSLRDVTGSLDEDQRFVELALVKEFWDEPRKKKDDISEGRIAQLDRIAPWMDALNQAAQTAAKAYLDVYYGRQIEKLLREQTDHLKENLRVLKAQEAQREALEIDRIDMELALAEIDKSLVSIRTKLERQLGALRQYWGMSDLTEEELAPPEISAASGIQNAEFEEILDQAEMHRPDLRAAEMALAMHRSGREFTPSRPELELKVAGRMGEMDRDWTDEGREDSTYEAEAELRLTYPLSQRRRNAVKLKAHTLLETAMHQQMNARREEVRRKVSEACEIHRQFCEDLKIKALEIEKAEEQERLIRLQSETMPEVLGTDPLSKVRTARVDVLAAKVDYLKIERDRMQAQVDLLAEVGKLTPSPIPLLRVGQ